MNARFTAQRAFGKAKRAALRAPVIGKQFERSYYASLGRYGEQLPWPRCYPIDLLTDLRKSSVVSVDGAPYFDEQVIADAQQFADVLRRDTTSASTVEVPLEALSERPSVYQWGLADAQLDLAEWYIGLPVRYLGVTVKLERADARLFETRQWHRDIEDRRMVKFITYLSDVDPTCGPLAYLERPVSDDAVAKLGYWSGFVSDARLATVVAPSEWRLAVGPALTTTIVDTCRLLHRATPPSATDRYSMTFSYCSARPLQLYDETLPSRRQVDLLTAGLSERQTTAAHLTG